MSGGGNEKRMGRMGRSVAVKTNVISQDDLNLLEDNVRKLQEKASSLHMRMNELENEIIILTKEVRGLKTKYSSIKMEIENLIQQESSLKKQVSSQEAVVEKTVSDPEVVKQKTQTIEKLKEEFDKAAAESGVLEEQVAELTSKINNITGGKMQAAQQKLDKVTKQLDKVTSDITKLKVAIKTSDRNCKKSRDRIQAVTNEIAVTEENLKKAQDENKECEEELLKVKDFIETISTKISTITKTIGELKEEKTLLNTEVNALKVALVNESKNSEDVGKQIAEVNEVLDNLKKELSELFLYSIPNYKDPCPTKLPVFTDEEIEEMNYEIVSYNVVVYDEKQNPTETPNLKAIDEYQEKQQIFEARQAELEDAVSRRNEAKSGLDHARKARLNEFIGGFSIITQKLKEMYQMITFGGDAELELVDTLDPFAEGVGFSVRPPKKSWKFISNLSGGEKTLSSLALVFALHYYKPSPLYVMDEIDAALDFKNVSIVGNYIKERTRNAQFIIISLRSNMFELADVLVGIYKTHNCTKSVTVTPKLFAAKDRNSNVNKAAVTNGHRHNSEENDGAVNTQVEIVREVSVPDSDITRSPPRKRQK